MIFGTPGDPFWTALNGSVISQYEGLSASPLEALVSRRTVVGKALIDRAFGDLGLPVEWTDEIEIQGFGQYGMTIPIKPYATAIGIDDFDLSANDVAPYLKGAGELAQTCRWWWVAQIRAMINEGETTALGQWYDEKPLFAANHEIGASGEFSNLISTGSGKTAAGVNADLGAVRARMASYRNDKGDAQIVPIEPDTILYDATDDELQAAMDVLYFGAVLLGQPSWRGRVREVIGDPGLAGTGCWYGICTTRPQKPFRLLPGVRAAKPGETDVPEAGDGWVEVEYRKTRRPEWLYIYKLRAGAAIGDPRLIVKVVPGEGEGGGE